MKTRFVKLLGLLTVLMVPVVLWVSWPYWHPMWWTTYPPRIDQKEVEASVHNFHNFDATFDPEFKDFALIAWTEGENRSGSHSRIVYLHWMGGHLIVHLVGNDTDHGWHAVSQTEIQAPLRPDDISRFLDEAWLAKGWVKVSPHAWKRVTGEVLTPSRLKELESGGVVQ